MFKVNSRDTRTGCEMCSKFTIKIPERHHCSRVFIVNFDQINAGWDLYTVCIKVSHPVSNNHWRKTLIQNILTFSFSNITKTVPGKYLLMQHNRHTGKRCEICSKSRHLSQQLRHQNTF